MRREAIHRKSWQVAAARVDRVLLVLKVDIDELSLLAV
jgi:hypothetical protein